MTKKKAGTKGSVPVLSWLVARINLCERNSQASPGGQPRAAVPTYSDYAVLLGRTVKSLTCVKMLDICIPLSCETKGRISAMN